MKTELTLQEKLCGLRASQRMPSGKYNPRKHLNPNLFAPQTQEARARRRRQVRHAPLPAMRKATLCELVPPFPNEIRFAGLSLGVRKKRLFSEKDVSSESFDRLKPLFI